MIQTHYPLRATSERADFIAELLEGEIWTSAEVAALEAEAQAHGSSRRRELLAEALTASQVADLLGVSHGTLHDHWQSRSLLGVMDDGTLRFPAWQFDAAEPDGMVAGLPEVVRALSIPVLSKIAWMMRPHQALDNRPRFKSYKPATCSTRSNSHGRWVLSESASHA